MKTKEEILKEAEIEWGLRVGPKSNQREQTRVLLSILSKALAQTREETIRDGIEQIEDLRKAIANQFGFRYDEHYENCIYILHKLKK